MKLDLAPAPTVEARFTLDRTQLTRGLVLLAAFVGLRYLAGAIWARAFGIGQYPPRWEFALLLLGVFLVVSVGLVGFGASRWAGIDLVRLWRGDGRVGRDLLAAVAGLAAIAIVGGASALAMSKLGLLQMPVAPPSPPSAGSVAGQALGGLFFGFFIASFSEETLFRGVLQTGLRSRLPAWAAIALQAALFSVSHVALEPAASVGKLLALAGFRFAAGVVLGTLFEVRGSLRAAGIAHGIIG
jgi:membrane protease YdiL (CAAX protease family)